MSQRPLVSVTVASYNYGRYLRDCIDSVLTQLGVDLELVIVDDASSDDSVEIARGYAARDARVAVFVHDANWGHIATYNHALELATGDYIVKLDSDDMLTPGALARSATVLRDHPAVGLVYGNPLTIKGGIVPAPRTGAPGLTVWPGAQWIRKRCRRGNNCIMQPEVMVRASTLRAVGGHRANLPATHDLNLWLRLAAVCDVARLRSVDQGWHRIHADSLLRSRYGTLIADLQERHRAFEDFFETAPAPVTGLIGELREANHRALAHESLGYACQAMESGTSGSAAADEYVRFAFGVWPEAHTLRRWRAFQRRVAWSARGRDRITPYRAVDLWRDVEGRVQWRRWRYTGL